MVNTISNAQFRDSPKTKDSSTAASRGPPKGFQKARSDQNYGSGLTEDETKLAIWGFG
jgi:hypothetical protein